MMLELVGVSNEGDAWNNETNRRKAVDLSQSPPAL